MQDRKVRSLLILILICIYRIVSDVVYIQIISTNFRYEGYTDSATMSLLIISWIILLVSVFLVRPVFMDSIDRISAIVIVVLYLISFVPFTSCIRFGIMDNGFIIFNCAYWFLLLLFEKNYMRRKSYRRLAIRIGEYTIDDRFVNIIGFASFALVLYISARYTHFRLNFNLFAVYELRSEALGYRLPTLIAYMFDWSKAVNPIMLGYCLLKKKYPVAFLYFFAQMLSFGVDGLKSTFFLPMLVVVSCIFLKNVSGEKIKMWILIAFPFLSLVSVLENAVFKTYFVAQLFVRRMEFTTNYIANCYYKFFSQNQPDFFRASFLRYFGMKSPYTTSGMSIGEFIASQNGRTGVNFNNGLFSDAITNMGTLGVFIMPFVVVTVLKWLDTSAFKLDRRLIVAIAFYVALTLLSSFMPTALLTHGVLIIIFLLYFMERHTQEG